MRNILIYFGFIFFASSCVSNGNATFGLNRNSALDIVLVQAGKPLENIEIQRWTKKKGLSKLFNPIGAFYHPYEPKNLFITDENGLARFDHFSNDDYFLIRNVPPLNLYISINALEYTSKTSDGGERNYDHSFFINNNEVQFTESRPTRYNDINR